MSDDRTDAWGATLTEDQRWQLYRAHYAHPSWDAVCAWAETEFGIPIPTRSAYYRFRQRMAERESEHRIELAITEKTRIGREMAEIGDLNPALIQAFQQRALESELRGDSNGAEKWLTLALDLGAGMAKKVELDLKRKAEARQREALQFNRDKFEFDAVRAAIAHAAALKLISQDSSIDEREKINRARQLLFSVLPDEKAEVPS
jgi:hypothetical protein